MKKNKKIFKRSADWEKERKKKTSLQQFLPIQTHNAH